VLDAGVADALGAFTERRQAQQRRSGEMLSRQRLEADHHCRQAERIGACPQLAEERAMPDMDAIEGADRDHAAGWGQRSVH
jgi:hypothetical protein